VNVTEQGLEILKIRQAEAERQRLAFEAAGEMEWKGLTA
jgi:hypothetical protein